VARPAFGTESEFGIGKSAAAYHPKNADTPQRVASCSSTRVMRQSTGSRKPSSSLMQKSAKPGTSLHQALRGSLASPRLKMARPPWLSAKHQQPDRSHRPPHPAETDAMISQSSKNSPPHRNPRSTAHRENISASPQSSPRCSAHPLTHQPVGPNPGAAIRLERQCRHSQQKSPPSIAGPEAYQPTPTTTVWPENSSPNPRTASRPGGRSAIVSPGFVATAHIFNCPTPDSTPAETPPSGTSLVSKPSRAVPTKPYLGSMARSRNSRAIAKRRNDNAPRFPRRQSKPVVCLWLFLFPTPYIPALQSISAA